MLPGYLWRKEPDGDLHILQELATIPASQFPSKYSQLPDINGPSLSSVSNQLIPYVGTPAVTSLQQTNADMDNQNERLRNMEMRINISEKSCRALLEEMVRLQSDLKAAVRRNEEMIHDQTLSRQQMESLIRKNVDTLMHLNSRIQRTEQKVQQDELALTSLKNHTKNLEQLTRGSHQDLYSNKDMHIARINEFQAQLEDVIQSKKQMEILLSEMSGGLRQLSNKVDSQGSKFSNAVSEMMHMSKRLENEHRLVQDSFSKNLHNQNDTSVSILREQMDSRVGELKESLLFMRQKFEQEAQQRISMEQNLNRKLSEMESSMNLQMRKLDDSTRQINQLQNDQEHGKDYSWQRLQGQLQDDLDDVSKRLNHKEITIKEEIEEKFQQLEKMIQQEHSQRVEFERSVQSDTDRRAQANKQKYSNDLQKLMDSIKTDRSKTKDMMQKLNEGLQLLEDTFDGNRKQLEKIVSAEIHSRKNHEKDTVDKFGEILENIQLVSVHLQQNLGELKGQLEEYIKNIQKDLQDSVQNQNDASTRALADLDTRLRNESEKLANLENSVEDLVAQMMKNIQNPQDLKKLTDEIPLQIDAINKAHEDINNELKDCKNRMEQFPNDLYSLDERLKLLKSEVESRVSTEAQIRLENIDDLQNQISSIPRMPVPPVPYATTKDIENCQNSIKRLAESIQTVKTVLGMKIQSEQKLRIEEIRGLQDEIIRLQSMMQPLIHRHSKNFIKDDRYANSAPSSSNVNRWVVYNAYRWLTWKSKWMYPLWKKASNDSKDPEGKKKS